MLEPFIIVATVGIAISFFFSALFMAVEGRWPHWHFALFLSWWWPFRGESAATVAAVALDCDDSGTEWCYSKSYSTETIDSTELQTRVVFTDLDGVSLRFSGRDVPLSAWDSYCLTNAASRWIARHSERVRDKAKYEAAETLVKAFKAKRRGSPR